MAPSSELCPLLWFDCETTGLDKQHDQIIEVAAFITTPTVPYERLDRGHFHSLVQPEPPYVVGDYVLRMHTLNGLWRELTTEPAPSLAEVERELVAYIGRTVGGSKVTLAGSGVATFDMQFIERRMPRVHKRLTYFTFDTGVIRRYRQSIGKIVERDDADDTHRALDDTRAALKHLQEYAAEDTVYGDHRRRLTIACERCYRPIGVGVPMTVTSAQPPRFAHTECPAPEGAHTVVNGGEER